MEEIIILPGEYQQVEYIESHGEEYINTGIKANSNIKMEVTLINPDMSDDNDHTLCGGGVAWGEQYLQLQCRLNSMCSYGDDGDRVDFHGGNITTICQDKNNFYQDGELLSTFSSQQFNTNYDIYIFCAAQSNVPAEFSSFKVAAFKIYNDNNLVRDFIACVRVTDGEAGLYDLVTETFYTNEGSGVFTYPDTPADSRLSQNLERIRQATNDIRSITGTDNDEIEVVAQAVSDLNDDNIAKDIEIADLERQIEEITPKGTIMITDNGTYDVAPYANANVNVSGGSETEILNKYFDINMVSADYGEGLIKKSPTYIANGFNKFKDFFARCTGHDISITGTFGKPNRNTIESMFNSSDLQTINIPAMDVSEVTNFNRVFDNCTIPYSEIQKIINNWNTSSATTFQTTFGYLSNRTSHGDETLNVGSLNTSNVTDFYSCFYKSENVIGYGNWDISKGTRFNQMFDEFKCNKRREMDCSNGTNTNQNLEFDEVFRGCKQAQRILLTNLDTSTNYATARYDRLFFEDKLLHFADIRKLRIAGSQTNVDEMFRDVSKFCTIIVPTSSDVNALKDRYSEFEQIYTAEEFVENNNLYTNLVLNVLDPEGMDLSGEALIRIEYNDNGEGRRCFGEDGGDDEFNYNPDENLLYCYQNYTIQLPLNYEYRMTIIDDNHHIFQSTITPISITTSITAQLAGEQKDYTLRLIDEGTWDLIDPINSVVNIINQDTEEVILTYEGENPIYDVRLEVDKTYNIELIKDGTTYTSDFHTDDWGDEIEAVFFLGGNE